MALAAAEIDLAPAPTGMIGMGRQLIIGGDATQRDLSGDEKAAVLLLSLGRHCRRSML